MQTFLPYPDFAQSARCLDNKRLGKQRVECLQILKTLSKGPTEVIQKVDGRTNKVLAIYRKTPWYNHPAVQMWKGYHDRLVAYGCAMCHEWSKRGFNDTCCDKIIATLITAPPSNLGKTPPWLGNEAYHASHRSNLLRKDFAHYSQFGWTEPTTLPYVWPSKL